MNAPSPTPSQGATSAGVGLGVKRLHTPRTLAELNRDVLIAFRRHPMMFIVLPLVAWFPFDVGLEAVGAAFSEPLTAFRAVNRLERILSFTLGTALVLTAATAVDHFGRGEKIGIGAAFSAGLKRFGAAVGAGFLSGFVVLGAALLLVLPAFFAMARLALVIPVVVLEDKSAGDALRRSNELVKSIGTFKVLAYGFTTYLAYFGLTQLGSTAYMMIETPLDGTMWGSALGALLTLPANLLPIGIAVGTMFLYNDAVATAPQSDDGAEHPAYIAPYGLSLRAHGQVADAPRNNGMALLAGVLLAGVVAATAYGYAIYTLVGDVF